MLLVLCGHYGDISYWPPLWRSVVAGIYLFHMPLFMAISGYLSEISYQKEADVAAFLKRRWTRIVIPYLTVEIVFLCIKSGGQMFFRHHPPSLSTLLNIVILPEKGPAAILWFIYTLGLITTAHTLLRQIIKNPAALVILGCVVALVPAHPGDYNYGQYADVLRLFVYYALGGALASHYQRERNISWTLFFIGIAGFCGGAFWFYSYHDPLAWQVGAKCATLLSALSAICVLTQTANFLAGNAPKAFLWVGKHSAEIYFFHLPFTWFVAVLLHEKLHANGLLFMAGLPVAILLGLTLPVLITCFLEKRSRWAAFLLQGNPRLLAQRSNG